MSSLLRRIDFSRVDFAADAGIIPRYPADRAAWIWHPDCLTKTAFLRFTLEVDCEREESVELQVSADQRFQLFLDGELFACGPDRSDLNHWSVQTYGGSLRPGKHVFTALVWWIADTAFGVPNPEPGIAPPMAQVSFRGGFLLAALGDSAPRFNTGRAPWKVEDMTPAVTFEKIAFADVYHDVGPSFIVDAAKWKSPGALVDPVVVRESVLEDNQTGVSRPGWRLETSPLPEQRREIFSGGKIRQSSGGESSVQAWQGLVAAEDALRIEAHTDVTVMWDFESYVCGYPKLEVQGGVGARVSIEWAEALFEEENSKGHRDEVEGKKFIGFGDTFISGGGERFEFPTFWWRSGRYLKIRIETGEEPLVLERLSILSTRYPLECESHLESDDTDLEKIAALAVNTMQQGTHELFTDCPYYEQMAYVGDNVTEALVSYVMTGDTRITRRATELFDWSRSFNGLVAERWPNACYQGSATYAMLWPSMLRNHAFWRREPDFIREHLRGVRHLIEELLIYRKEDGLMGRLPGWSFVDWAPEWPGGYPPGHETGDSSVIQMHWLMCLQTAAELEEHFGEPEFSRRLRRFEAEVREKIIERYRCAETGLFFDDGKGNLSEQANVLATVLGLRAPSDDPDWPEKLAARPHARCTVYFTHYLFEAYRLMRREDLFFERLGLWRSFLEYGLHTIPEQPEPTRSDCHAWGAHPLYHFHTTLAGIQPASPGFQTVHVRPLPGKLKFLKGSLPHPDGEIQYDFRFDSGAVEGVIVLPKGVTGTFEVAGVSRELTEEKNLL
ncbi:MAG: alpha-L-rhamnosidase C-terminal domain-containing protein [Chthoniobacterales bacterium]